MTCPRSEGVTIRTLARKFMMSMMARMPIGDPDMYSNPRVPRCPHFVSPQPFRRRQIPDYCNSVGHSENSIEYIPFLLTLSYLQQSFDTIRDTFGLWARPLERRFAAGRTLP